MTRWHEDNFTISDELLDVDLDVLHNYLANESYWGPNIPKEILINAVNHSLNFSLINDGKFIGYARTITDYSTFAYLADVYIDGTT